MKDTGGALAAWLRRLETLDPTRIQLGLERVRPVANTLGVLSPSAPVITVAGTNGKGSTVAFIDAIATAAGLRVGAYLSPHVQRFNERVRIAGVDVADADLVRALEAVEVARGDTPLTYFEFISLAALWLFSRASLDLWVLEVGLGGRLDVVNVVDADVAVITSIGLDHQDWLGDTRDAIAREKAGIRRPGRPLVVGETDVPDTLVEIMAAHDGDTWLAGREITVEQTDASAWSLRVGTRRWDGLPAPALAGAVMQRNAGLAVAALQAAGVAVSTAAMSDGLQRVRLPGRLQRLHGQPDVWLDTAHNPQAAAMLGASIAAMPPVDQTHVVLAMLSDKDARGVVDAFSAALVAHTELHWFCASLGGPRGLAAEELAARAGVSAVCAPSVGQALAQARRAAAAAGVSARIVCFGSFLTVEAALADD